MEQVRDRLWIGNSADACNGVVLGLNGITSVVNVAFDLDDPKYDPKIFKTFKVGLVDGPGNHPVLKQVAIDLVNNLLLAHETVLVHCHQGIGRAAWVVATVLADIEQIPFDTAYRELREIRPQIREVNRLIT